MPQPVSHHDANELVLLIMYSFYIWQAECTDSSYLLSVFSCGDV